MKYKTVVLLALVALGVTVNPEPQVGPTREKVCFQAPEACNELKEAANAYIRGANVPRNYHFDASKSLETLQHLFRQESECRVDICKCIGGKLECSLLTDKIRVENINTGIPDCVPGCTCCCLGNVTVRLSALKEAMMVGDYESAADNFGLLNDELKATVQGNNSVAVSCVRELADDLRYVSTIDLEKSCDFCSVDFNYF